MQPADVAGQHDAGVGVDVHPAAHHPDRRAAALPQAALEGAPAEFSSVSALCNSSLCWEPTKLPCARSLAVCRVQLPARLKKIGRRYVCRPVHRRHAALDICKKGSGQFKAYQLHLRQVLDEIQAGVFDGMTYAQIEQTMPEEFAARKADKLGYRCVRLLCSHV